MMKKTSIKALLIMLAITYGCFSQSTNSAPVNRTAPTYAPAPPINKTEALNITTTMPTSIDSQKLEVIEARPNIATNTTELKISAYNSSAPGKQTNFNISNLPGKWELFKSSTEDISCQAIKQNSSNTINFLRFDQTKQEFKVVLNISQAELRSQLSVATRNNSLDSIKENIKIGANCSLIGIENKILRINETMNGAATLAPVTTASTFRPEYVSANLQYSITNNTLFKYRNMTFEQIYRFPPHDKYKMVNFQNRIIVTGSRSMQSNISLFNSSTNTSQAPMNIIQFNQTVFILLDSTTAVTLVGQFPLMGKDVNGSDSAPMHLSPSLTKIGFVISKFNASQSVQNETKQFVLLNVDYNGPKMTPIRNQNPEKLADLLKGVRGPGDLFLGDKFFVLRNQGLCGVPGVNCTQICYQFIGDNLKQIGSREVTDPEEKGANFQRIFFDRAVSSTPVVLVAVKTASGLKITEYKYNNFAAITKIIPPVVPKFFEAIVGPTDQVFLDSGDNIQLTVIKAPANGQTSVQSIRIKDELDTTGTNVRNVTAALVGSQRLVDSNKRCALILNNDTANSLNLSINQKLPSGAETRTPVVSSEFPPSNSITPNTTFYIGLGCQKIAIDTAIFVKTIAGNWAKVTNNTVMFKREEMDDNMTYGILNGNIWKYNAANRNYTNYFNHTLGPKVNIISSGNKLLVMSVNSTGIQNSLRVFVYLDSQAGLVPVFRYNQTYFGQFQFKVSEILDNIVVVGKVRPPLNNATDLIADDPRLETKADILSIDFSRMLGEKVNFPRDTLNGPQIPKITIFTRFMHIRQVLDRNLAANMPNSANYTNMPRQQFVYYFDDSKAPKLIFTKKITPQQGLSWERSMIKPFSNNKVFLLSMYMQSLANLSSRIVIKSQQLSILAANVNTKSDSSKPMGVLVVNNLLVTCFPGCQSCSNRVSCDTCSPGYQLANEGSDCLRCGPSCSACDSTNPQICTSCLNSTTLTGTSCVRCTMVNCLVCTGSVCTTCTPGRIYNPTNATCDFCTVRNCHNCSSLTVCVTCREGYALTTAGECKGCPSSCSRCNPNNITQCVGCDKGFVMKSNKCQKCPLNCLNCNENLLCQNCTVGYKTNANGACVLECKYPCLTCSQNSPSVCLSCYGTEILVGSKCNFNISCNTTAAGCQNCGVGYYGTKDGYCYACSDLVVIPNCIKCNYMQTCDICEEGFYLNSSSLCAPCSSDCQACESKAVCKKCAVGYTLPRDAEQGQCIVCQSPCLTCRGSATTCTSCVGGQVEKGARCRNSTYSKCSIRIQENMAAVAAVTDAFVAKILNITGQAPTRTDLVIIQSIVDGSTIISAEVTSTTSSAAVTTAALAAGLASSSSIGSLTVLSSTVTTEGSSDQSTAKTDNTGMIVGIVIGSVVAVAIIGGLLIYFLYVKKQAMTSIVKVDDIASNHVAVLQNEKLSPSKMELQSYEK